MSSITVPANEEALDEITEFIDGELGKVGCPPNIQIQMTIEEVFVNIANYAYENGEGNAEITCTILDDPLTAEISFKDSGVPFDPTQKEEADITLSAEERAIGGLGIHLVRQLMDEIAYERENDKNILMLVKWLNHKS